MTVVFEKMERDGKIAVIYSPGYGAGWFTWNDDEGLLFDREIVEAVLAEDLKKAVEIAEKRYPSGYFGGGRDLSVMWIPKGFRFIVAEYNGSESVTVIGPDRGHVA